MKKEMFDALLKVQVALPKLEKTASNPFYKSKYVPLESVLDAVLPVLHKNGFVLLQKVTNLQGMGDAVGALETTLEHSSGESVTSVMPLDSKENNPQAQGSAITYARRYALVSLLGLATESDDDGNASSKTKAEYEDII
jgi:hypothetical protein